MRRKTRLAAGLGLLAAFAWWTAAVCTVDVQPVGADGSSVGFAAVNSFVHRLTGVHMDWYLLTDWLSLLPAGLALGFALLGLAQWIARRSLLKVDKSILALGGLYLAVAAAYVLFEAFPVNYRPVLIEGMLEASYPSSTTMLVLCVMPSAAMQLSARMKGGRLRRWLLRAIAAFTALMVLGRLVSGVHWLTDIIGGALLSAGLTMLYASVL